MPLNIIKLLLPSYCKMTTGPFHFDFGKFDEDFPEEFPGDLRNLMNPVRTWVEDFIIGMKNHRLNIVPFGMKCGNTTCDHTSCSRSFRFTIGNGEYFEEGKCVFRISIHSHEVFDMNGRTISPEIYVRSSFIRFN